MTRWWADADQSRAVLALVDDSDLEQGVGTAVLGYHGIASSALERLSRHTLVDVARVHQVLDDVDLEPVAKALGEATRPVLGAASGRYGQLLASNLHQQAVDATERLLLSLTNTGMPWPTAIERVASVHGVPADRLGKAYGDLGKPALAPTVRADIGDRVLMEFASHVARRESTPMPMVSKSMDEEFDPDEHPRDGRGRFAHAPERGTPSSAFEAREARRKRKAAVNIRRQKAQRSQRQAPGGLADLAAAIRHQFGASQQAEQEPVTEQLGSKRADRLNARRSQRIAEAKGQRKLRSVGADDAPEDDLAKPFEGSGMGHKFDDHRVALVTRDQADHMLKSESFYMGNVDSKKASKVTWLTPDDMESLLRGLNQDPDRRLMLSEYVMLSIDGTFASSEGGPRDPEITMAGNARLNTLKNAATNSDGYDYQQDKFLRWAPSANPGSRRGLAVPMPVLHLELDNDGAFPRVWDDRPYANKPSAKVTPDLPHDPLTKADEFDENEVRRDSRGRFDDQPDRVQPTSGFDAREGRRKRKAAKNRFRTQQAQRKAPKAPVLTDRDYAVLRQMMEADEQASTAQILSSSKPSKREARMAGARKDRLAHGRKTRIDARKRVKAVQSAPEETKESAIQAAFISGAGFSTFNDAGDPWAEQQQITLRLKDASTTSVTDALLRMAGKARGEAKSTPSNERHVIRNTGNLGVDEAYAMAVNFFSDMVDASKDAGEDGMFLFNGKSIHVDDLANASPIVERRIDFDTGEQKNIPVVIAPSSPLVARTMVTGDKTDWKGARKALAVIDGEPKFRSFYEVAAEHGIGQDVLMHTPDFIVNEYALRFVDTDD